MNAAKLTFTNAVLSVEISSENLPKVKKQLDAVFREKPTWLDDKHELMDVLLSMTLGLDYPE